MTFSACRAELNVRREDADGIPEVDTQPLKRQPQGYLERGTVLSEPKGMIVSEVFDWREYYPEMTSAQFTGNCPARWILVIVREGSDTSHYDTILLFDAWAGGKEKQWG